MSGDMGSMNAEEIQKRDGVIGQLPNIVRRSFPA
jgi:hypothetical protein